MKAVVSARGLGVHTRRGWVFRDVDLDVAPGELIALVGAAGSGRTSLLLALAGRFKVTAGTLDRHGTAALAYVPGATDPEPNLTVAEHVEERLLLTGRAPWRPAPRRALVARLVSAVAAPELAEAPPDRAPGSTAVAAPEPAEAPPDRAPGSTAVAAPERAGAPDPSMLGRDLSTLDRHLLGLALARTSEPDLILVDDADSGMSTVERGVLWDELRKLTADRVAVVVACREATDHLADRIIVLERNR
jgi:ABC-2 type transport system ATP-binding protein